MGSPADLAATLHIVEHEVCFHFNHSKSLLYILEMLTRLSLSYRLTSPPPAVALLSGLSIGPPDYCEEVFSSRLSKVKVTLGALHGMGDAQVECTLLCSCLALPKVSFILCACPPCHIQHTAAEIDSAIH